MSTGLIHPSGGERRRVSRRTVLHSFLIPIEVGNDENFGLMIDLGEGGTAIQTHVPLTPGSRNLIRWTFPSERDLVEIGGEIAWVDDKLSGVRFVDVSPKAHNRIRHWLRILEAPTNLTEPDRQSNALVTDATPVWDKNELFLSAGGKPRNIPENPAPVTQALGNFGAQPDQKGTGSSAHGTVHMPDGRPSKPAGDDRVLLAVAELRQALQESPEARPFVTSGYSDRTKTWFARLLTAALVLIAIILCWQRAPLFQSVKELVLSAAFNDGPELEAPSPVQTRRDKPPTAGRAQARSPRNPGAGKSGSNSPPSSTLTPAAVESLPLVITRLQLDCNRPDILRTPVHTTPALPRGEKHLSPPVPLATVQPEYPAAARARRLYGVVVLDVTVTKHGGIGDVRVVSGDSLLAEAAKRATSRWRYKAAELNGHPVQAIARVVVDFNGLRP
jgi:TonB family protein